MDRKKFEQLVERSLQRLPKKFLEALENIAIEVEGEPPQDVLDDMGIEDDGLYGLYQGTPLTEREWNYGNVLPDRITIYQGPIERDARNDEESSRRSCSTRSCTRSGITSVSMTTPCIRSKTKK